jgi:hypothetical protein
MVGGTESDRFNFNLGSGADLIVNFIAGSASDGIIGLVGWGSTFDAFTDVLAAASQVGADVVMILALATRSRYKVLHSQAFMQMTSFLDSGAISFIKVGLSANVSLSPKADSRRIC